MVHGHFRRLSMLQAAIMEVEESRVALAEGKNDQARVFLDRARKSIERVAGELARAVNNDQTWGD
jgi:hypothetical protein